MEDRQLEKVLSKKDVLALAFGAMIGWGWVILAGLWIQKAGSLGAALAFGLGGIMIVFVGLTYAELTAAMPQSGGALVFSNKALGVNMSFICTWAMILGYVGVVAFEAVALPSVVEYLIPGFLQRHMYTIHGFDVYGSWVAVGVISSIVITAINYRGTKDAATLQAILTVVIAVSGIALMGGSTVTGNLANTKPFFVDGWNGIVAVAIATPFMFIGFDVIPQTASEINLPFKDIGKMLILSILMSVAWYVIIILSVSYVMSEQQLLSSVLVTADAMKIAFGNSDLAAKILIIGGLAGIVSSWNAFLIGGSRAMYALSQAKMLPEFLGKIHPKYNTPSNAILLIGGIASIAPFFGRSMLDWLANAGSFGIVIAYGIVSISFVVLRKKDPNMPRPYRIKNYKFVGYLAVILSGVMLLLYIPGLITIEWVIIGGWALLGLIFFITSKNKFIDFGKIPELKKSEN
ncbi:APC family permease [Alkaliphilus sp. B6464]|uniref:APC family permease n=1 Tax=Alkaliphilus sp. B6464 TaxID=2731219 RepID=UPI001BACD135|nr:APC family permease [Alkaliphilus sp. B6464]QUH19323.1 amino acid permease [Alkaliphilus sp. B6464]